MLGQSQTCISSDKNQSLTHILGNKLTLVNGKGGGRWLMKSICSHNVQNPIETISAAFKEKKKQPRVESVDPWNLTFYSTVFDSVSR